MGESPGVPSRLSTAALDQRLLETIIEDAPEGFALFDRDLRYVRVNQALAAINGVAAADHVGRTLDEIVPGVPRSGHEEPLREVLATGRPVDVETTGTTAADPGRPRTWHVSYYPVRDAGGEVSGIGAFVLDITERREAEHEAEVLAELAAILDEVVGVEERLARLVAVLVPRVADTVTVALVLDGELERVAVAHVDPEAERALATIRPLGADALPQAGTGPVAVEVTDELLQSVSAGPEDLELRRRVGLRSGVLLPMTVRGRLVGQMALGSLRPAAFGPREVSFGEEIARRAALAVDNARLFEGERIARERSTRLQAVTAALSEALTPSDVATAILGQALPAVGASMGGVWQVSEDGAALEAIGQRGYPDPQIRAWWRVPLEARLPLADAVRNGRPGWWEDNDRLAEEYPHLAEALGRAATKATAAIPLMVRGRAVGAMTIAFPHPHRFEPDERAFVAGLGSQCAQALDRARLYESERRVAATLQRSLLPSRLPEVPGVDLAVSYLPAAGLEAGGDFYEALELPGGSIGLAVGDVVGRGANAAATMGQLRSALRAFALGGDPPATVLERLSAFAETVDGAMAATAVYAQLDPVRGELRYACAGHPWPLVLSPDGEATYLQDARALPLGTVSDPDYVDAVAPLPPGSTLLLYTDGLTDRRDQRFEEAFEVLRTSVMAHREAALRELLASVLADAGPEEPTDDVALLAVRTSVVSAPALRMRLPAQPEQVAQARARLRTFLEEVGADALEAGDILLAAGEATANAVEHAYAATSADDATFELEALLEGERLGIVVRDHGTWREGTARTHRGHGLELMRALMEEVDVESGPAGTVVRMHRRIAPSAAPAPGGAAGVGAITAFQRHGRAVVAEVRGDVDLVAAPGLADSLAKLADGVAVVVADLSQAGYLDSAGARMLVEAGRRLDARLVVVAPEGSPSRRTLELSGLASVLRLADSVPAALAP